MNVADIDLSGQTAVVTGASRGIGREMSLYLARAGVHVILMARDESLLEKAVDEIRAAGGKAEAFAVDVAEPQSVKAAFARAEKVTGSIDLLVNNAGVSGSKSPISKADPDAWWKTMEINLRGVFLCCQAVLPGMIQRKRGRIINLGSGLGLIPFPDTSDYSVSKAALLRLTDNLAEEVREHGLAVFAISPGMVKTDMTLDLKEDNVLTKTEWTPIERSAELCVYLASGRADALTGRYIHASKDDLEAMIADADRIVEEDLHTLRLKQ